MINRSAEIGELAKALATAQGAMENASKDKLNPHFKSKYADLGSVWDAIREPLSKNGLSVVQLPCTDDGGKVQVTTLLMHASGQWIEATYSLRPTKDDPQGVGSAITYMKRYALAGIGVAPEDDDGNLASARNGNGNGHAPAPVQQRHAEPRGEAQEPAESPLAAFLKGKKLIVPVPGARAGKPDFEAWCTSVKRAIDACTDVPTLDRLWSDNEANLAALGKEDVALRVDLEQEADTRRAMLTPDAADRLAAQ